MFIVLYLFLTRKHVKEAAAKCYHFRLQLLRDRVRFSASRPWDCRYKSPLGALTSVFSGGRLAALRVALVRVWDISIDTIEEVLNQIGLQYQEYEEYEEEM